VAALNRVHTTEHETEAPHAVPPTGALDEAFLGEGRQLVDRACTGDHRERGQTAVMIDDLLDRARSSLRSGMLSPPGYARVLRASALVRNMARLPELPPDPLVHDLVAHTVRHGLAAHNAAAQALRGTLAISRGLVDEALDAAVDAMATVELLDEHTVERALAMSDTAALLDMLGLGELSTDLYGRAAAAFGEIGMLTYQIMITGDQVRTEVLHGMWLERLGQAEAGAERFAAAAQVAESGMRLWQDSDSALELDEDFAADFHAAIALADPDGDHEEALRKATSRIALPGQILAGLVLVRVMAAAGRHAEADAALFDLRAACQRFQLGMPLRLALARGVLDLPREDEGSSAVVAYLTQIEDELWVMRSARTRALHARLEHERLRRGRSPMRALTAKDPVTALPDRTVLDELLGSLDLAARPVAMAIVDVDDLVRINQRGSFADGDATLRAVAVTVRGAVRPEDAVVRYSADDFVVLMPGRTLDEAAELMRGVVTAVTELTHDRGHGATVSIGVIAVDPHEGGENALARADDATGQARARGGSQVAVAPTTPAPR